MSGAVDGCPMVYFDMVYYADDTDTTLFSTE